MRHLLILFVLASSLLLLTGCGGGAEGMADADGLAGEGIDALGMDEATADLANDATAFMKTTQDNSGNASGGIFPPITTSDVPNPILNSPEETPLLAQAVIPPASSLSPRDRWTGAAISVKEAGTNQPQGQVDVIQSIHNRIGSSGYRCNGIADCVNADDNGDGRPDQYEPVFGNPAGWRNINSPESAARVTGLPVSEIIKADQNINNPKLQQNAADHVGCFTDFQGMSQKRFKKPADVDRGNGHNFFGNFYPSSGYKCK